MCPLGLWFYKRPERPEAAESPERGVAEAEGEGEAEGEEEDEGEEDAGEQLGGEGVHFGLAGAGENSHVKKSENS